MATGLEAATLYWDTDFSTVGNNSSTGANLGGTGTWTTNVNPVIYASSNWWNQTSLQPWVDGNDAVFWGAAGRVEVDVDSVNSMTFKTSGYVVTNGTLTMTGNPSMFTVDSNDVATIYSTIAGSNTMWKVGAGTLVLGTNNINTVTNTGGGWRIEGGGTLRLMGDTSLGATLPDAARNSLTDIQLNQSTIQAGAPLTVTQNRRTKVNTNASTNAGDGIIDTAGNSFSWFGSIQGGVGSIKVINSGPNPGILILGTDKIASINPFGSGLPTGATNLTIQSGAIVQTSGQVTPTGGELGAETNASGGALTIKLDNGQIRAESGGYTFYRNVVLGSGGGSFDTGAWIHTIEGGTISGAGALAKYGTGTLVLDNPAATWSGGTYIHNGTFQLGVGGSSGLLPGTLAVPSSVVIDAGATLKFLRGSNKSFFDIISGGGGILVQNSPTAKVRLVSDNTYSGPTSIASGILMIGQGNPGEPGSIASPSILNYGELDFNRVEDITYGGTIAGTGVVNKMGAGKLMLTGTNTYAGLTGISAGTLIINGSLASTPVFVTNGVLGGSGLLRGPVTIQPAGTVTPLGVFTISNSLTLLGNAIFRTDAAANGCDQVRGLSSVNLGGTLTISNLNGTIGASTQFKILSANSYSGSFASIVPSPGTNLAWNTNTLKSDGTLRVVSTSSPQVDFLASGNSITLSWPPTHIGWRLQFQTNALSAGIGTNWTDVAGSTLTNQITIAIDPSAACTFYRLVYP